MLLQRVGAWCEPTAAKRRESFRNSKVEASWRTRLRRSQLPAGSAVVILLGLMDLMRNRCKICKRVVP